MEYEIHNHGDVHCPPGTCCGPREMRDYEYVLVLGGKTILDTPEGRLPGTRGTLFLARPRWGHCFHWDREEGTHHAFIHFMPNENEEPFIESLPVAMQLSEGSIIPPLFLNLIWLLKTEPAGYEEQADRLLVTIREASRHSWDVTDGSDTQKLSPDIVRLMRKIAAFWDRDGIQSVSIKEMSRMGHMSPASLFRIFRKEFGQSPDRMMTALRLYRGAELLANTEMRVGEVADITGFKSPYHFSRLFSRHYQCCPRDYRHTSGLHLELFRSNKRQAEYASRLLFEKADFI